LRQFVLVFGMTSLTMLILLQTNLLARLSYSIERGRIRAWREELPAQARLDETYASARAMAEVVAPAVVNIETQTRVGPLTLPLSRRWLRPADPLPVAPPGSERESDATDDAETDGAYQRRGLGSGFVIDADAGYIVTNEHVVADADRIIVGLADGRRVPAEVVGTDSASDLAVLKVNCGQLHALPLGDSRSAQVGDDVFAVGNPFGLDGSFSRGIISARGRSNINIHGIQYQRFLQTDAVINPGNSGGPLVNLRGEVVGVNTAIATQTGHYDGVGFAIPSWRVSELLPQLIRGGEVVRGYLGVEIVSTLGREDAAAHIDGGRLDGVQVARVAKGTPAARAGLRAGDVILSINDVRLSETDELIDLVAASPPGTVLPLELVRDGQRLTLSVAVGRQPAGFRPRPYLDSD